jgi:two-component system KDP operon response regulator KdpE
MVSQQGVLCSEDGYLRMHVEERQVFAREQLVALTKTEFAFLHYLMIHADHVVTNRTLLQTIWGPEYGEESDYIRVYVRQIRCKLEPDPSHPTYIRTVSGVGYVFRSTFSIQEPVKAAHPPQSQFAQENTTGARLFTQKS